MLGVEMVFKVVGVLVMRKLFLAGWLNNNMVYRGNNKWMEDGIVFE